MKRVILFSLCLAALGMYCQSGSVGQASDSPKEVSKVAIYCPVVGLPETKSCPCATGNYCSLKPNARHTVEHKGAKVQLCCAGCAKVFKDAPAKFAVTANHQLLATKQAKQEKCPLCGGKTDPSATVEIAGVKIALCSETCRKQFVSAKAAERANFVFGELGFARGFVINVEKKK